jgi:hypothetical protein
MCKILMLIVICFSLSLNAQKISELSPQQLKADLDFLEKKIEQYNPALYVYNSKKVFTEQIDVIQNSIKKPIRALHFYKLLCLAVAGTNEGHITIGTEKDHFYKGFFGEEFKSLPLGVHFIGEKIYVWQNFSRDNILEEGDQILSINGHSSAEIRKQIFTYTVSDGAIETFKQAKLSKELSARYFWFIGQPDSFTIEYQKRFSEKTSALELEALSRPEMFNWSKKRGYRDEKPKGIAKVYSLSLKENVAYLKLNSFDEKILKENDIESYSFYKKIFRRIRENKVGNFIIDVRNNIGGIKEFGDDLLPFVLKKNRKGIYRELISSNGEVTRSAFPKRDGSFFKGKLYVLVNGGTFSTAALIAQYLREFADAVIIGEETGSRYEGFTAGTFHYSFLPNSNIRIGIPDKWVKNVISEKQETKNRGLIPDYPITLTIDDLIEGKDKALEKAFELIKTM